MRITERKLRSIIRSVIKESVGSLPAVDDWQYVWEWCIDQWDNYNIDYSDDEWDNVQAIYEELTTLNINDYSDEYDFELDMENCRNRFEDAASNWFSSGRGDDRRRVLNDYLSRK
tara:strand:+ start:780 stop:1124 length:345 start_codon:yes stop_codon:yes gene_type:complete